MNQSIKQVFNFVADIRTKSYSHLGYMSYNEQLQTKEWKYFRLYVIIIKGFKCELCEITLNVVKKQPEIAPK